MPLFASYLQERTRLVEKALKQMLPRASVKPKTIHEAMRYSLFAGGKRLRPLLCLAAAEACSLNRENALERALPVACALECLHTYSLIHDDLPAMDDDDLRRGRPTSHKVFGEGIAILAGDALLTESFQLLAKVVPTRRYPLQVFLQEMAYAAGSQRLIAGQVADLEAEGKKIKLAEVKFIHQCKTAALIELSLRFGAMVVNASPQKMEAITAFGSALGLAFQIMDDILDVTQSSEELGKSSGKDLVAEKATYPSVLGLPGAVQEAEKLTTVAMAALKPLGKRGALLQEFAEQLLKRTH